MCVSVSVSVYVYVYVYVYVNGLMRGRLLLGFGFTLLLGAVQDDCRNFPSSVVGWNFCIDASEI